MAKDPQAADDEVDQVVEELEVHHHGLVAPREGSSVPDETYQEDDFITNLRKRKGRVSFKNQQTPLTMAQTVDTSAARAALQLNEDKRH